jgi:hypothetical protein
VDDEGSTPEPDNLIAYVTYLPTEAATPWYHGELEGAPRDLAAFLQADMRRFLRPAAR